MFAAFDHLDDNQLQRVSLLVLGRGAPGSNEFNGITNHRVLVTEGIDDDMRETMHIPVGVISDVVIRVHVISHMRQEDMPTMYSSKA